MGELEWGYWDGCFGMGVLGRGYKNGGTGMRFRDGERGLGYWNRGYWDGETKTGELGWGTGVGVLG